MLAMAIGSCLLRPGRQHATMTKSKNRVAIADNLSLSDCFVRSMEIDNELHSLACEQDDLRGRLKTIDTEVAKRQSEKAQLEARAKVLRERPHVSDHALLRYLERKYDFDSDSIREEMLSPGLVSAIKAGAAGYKVDGGTFKIKGTTVVTYVRLKSN